MMHALVNGTPQRPLPKLTGTCTSCGEMLISKCGKRIVWHWAHQGRPHCDPWWENETRWHRDWKAKFPDEWHEAVMFDNGTGEKHIADVRTPFGLVVEFQNSPMSEVELTAREAFYGKMVWIVNGDTFEKNFQILEPLPDPLWAAANDVAFFRQMVGGRGGMFFRASEYAGPKQLVEMHCISSFGPAVQEQHVGHHQFEWKHPRGVWFAATAPVHFDFGNDFLWRLEAYDQRGLLCVRRVSKQQFVEGVLAGAYGT